MYDVIIVGSGPAGYTAALYTSRAFLKTLLLSGIQVGGQLTTTTHVENFPGFPDGILGPKLVEDMKKQVVKFGAEVQQAEAVSCQLSAVSQKERRFTIKTSDGEYVTKTVVIATGASAMYLGLSSEQTFAGKGVSACATCDGFFFRGKDVVVIGGGDTAMEEATFLTKFASKVTIIHRREEFRASKIMLDRAKKDTKISFLTNKTVEEIVGDSVVTGVRLRDRKTERLEEIKTDGVFLAIGHKPSTDFLKGFIELDEKGYIKVMTNVKFQMSNDGKNAKINPMLLPQTMTSVPGVFAAGDCVDPRYRQAVVAAGQGCMAAMDAEKYIEEQESNTSKVAR